MPTRPPSAFPLLLLALLAAGPSSAAGADRRALVIGIDRYRPDPRWEDLAGPTNDARAMADLLQGRHGFTVTLLLDEAATRDAILAAVRETIVTGAGPGSERVLFYAGHGSQVRNSLSPEADQLDETLLPHDGRDIRDFELGALLVQAARAGARVTALFDSCHSGSVTRGPLDDRQARAAVADLTDHPLAAERPDPAAAGVVTFSAVLPSQRAYPTTYFERRHGRFTAALLHALGAASQDESAQELAARVGAWLRTGGYRQDPVLDGPPERLRQPLLATAGAAPGQRRSLVAVAAVGAAGIELLGGPATGVTAGSRLVRHRGALGPLKLAVRAELGPTRSLAERVGAEADPAGRVQVGDLFELEAWEPSRSDRLGVDLGPPLPEAEVARFAAAVAPLRTSRKVHWIEDPALATPDWVVERRGGGWLARGPEGRETTLGAEPAAGTIEAAVLRSPPRPGGRVPAGPPGVFVRLPVTEALAAALGWTALDDIGPAEPGWAHYALFGRAGPSGPEYAAILLGGGAGRPGPSLVCAGEEQLPARTRWSGGAAAAGALRQDLAAIARVRGWLERQPAPGEPPFPYHLELRQAGQVISTTSRAGAVRPSTPIEVWLVADEARLQGYQGHRFVYALAIDCKGEVSLVTLGGGPSGVFPPEDAFAAVRREHRLDTFPLDATAGRYTFVLIAAREPIPDPRRLEQLAPLRRGSDAWWVERVGLQVGP